ncbi:MAG: NosD domain-containing protein, partial [Candidatus Thorarchaeota archaeon]
MSAYTEHTPIVITSNQNFSALGFSGSGVASDPYIIEDLNITSSSNCIDIRDTDAYFVIRGCLLSGDGTNNGVYLENVTHGMITRNLISDKSNGIGFYSSSYNNTVRTNTLIKNYYGVVLSSVDNNTLDNNTVTQNEWGGIFLSYSDYSKVTNNRIYNNSDDGLSLTNSDYAIIINNTINDNS